jgi:hypothetical protein
VRLRGQLELRSFKQNSNLLKISSPLLSINECKFLHISMILNKYICGLIATSDYLLWFLGDLLRKSCRCLWSVNEKNTLETKNWQRMHTNQPDGKIVAAI